MLVQQLPEPVPSPEEVRQSADDILSRAEFRPKNPSIFEEITDWIGSLFDDLFQPGAPGGSMSPVVGYVVLAAALIGVGLLLWRWLRRAQRDPEPGDEHPDPEADRSAADWLTAAERLEAEARWKDALRCRYRVLVGELVERDAIPDVPGRTAGEYRAEVTSAFPGVAPPFSEATELFELAWYADAPTGPDENVRFRSLTEDVLEGVR